MIRGQRFELNLDDDDVDKNGMRQSAAPQVLPGAFVGDVLERKAATPKPPTAPTLKSTTGFPEHKKRSTQSRFKQQNGQSQLSRPREAQRHSESTHAAIPSTGGGAKPKSWQEDEKQRIDDENRLKLASMSEAEIEAERRELMNSLSPALIERLLKRSNIESGSNESDLRDAMAPPIPTEPPENPKKTTAKSVSFAEPEPEPASAPSENPASAEDEEPSTHQEHTHTSIHFPQAPQPPSLDPNSTTFLSDLHEKYFPSLPSDPSKLEWMQSSQKDNKAYDPSASAFNAQDIRFSFAGELLAPKTASQIPVTEGLHHHGNAPDAAGYTIPELAHLARSTYAAQRCIAFQTLGRFLFRLGKGEFGDPGEPGAEVTGEEDGLGELARGLWSLVEGEKVVQMLVVESEGQGVDGGRHVSARAYATEAVWLWRKGGGRRWKAA
ncbi:hypothetical protein B0A50_08172 [Salinomyces thailandicus]|uniref:Transcription factor Rba50 n=1 Tax=Salinomyces thailandicus TaxID=706561 RepID=A0A4U0TKD5_9PEZI|nr:hypothetical protein B0A50_08172 [Salinomyces thailandica]